ncbi:MAG: DegT/DnrJ/EryC1/StrS family aminotransferase [Myxococcaceae bacterium]
MIGLANFKLQWEHSREAYLAAVERVGQSGWLILGKEVEQFEADLAKFWGAKYAVGVASGLDALEIAFRCAGMKAGDVVLTTPMSAFATTLAIVKVGAVPVFADLDEHGALDLDDGAKVIAGLPVKPRFIVPVHLYGHPMRLDRLSAFAQKHQLVVLEDCAQAIGASFEGRHVGSLSPVFATSFYPTKNLGAFGDGGALLTDDPAIRDRARCLRDYGQSDKYQHSEIGLNSRLDELHAAMMRSVQLPALASQTKRRREIAQRYLQGLSHPKLRAVRPPQGGESSWHLFALIVDGDRESFKKHLAGAGVASGVHYPTLIPHQPAMRELGHAPNRTRQFPVGERFAKQELSIPIHPFLTDAEVQTVIDACNRWTP